MPFSFLGLLASSMAAESTSWWSSLTSGNSSLKISVTVALHSLLVARTLALSMECTACGGLAVLAVCPASLAILAISERE